MTPRGNGILACLGVAILGVGVVYVLFNRDPERKVEMSLRVSREPVTIVSKSVASLAPSVTSPSYPWANVLDPKVVTTIPITESYVSAAAVDPRKPELEEDGDDVEEAMENPEPDDPLIKQWAHCNGNLGCVAAAVRDREKAHEPLIQQQTVLLGVDQALKQLQLFASDKKTRIRVADQAELAWLIPKGMVLTSRLREVVQQLLKQTNDALEDKDDQ